MSETPAICWMAHVRTSTIDPLKPVVGSSLSELTFHLRKHGVRPGDVFRVERVFGPDNHEEVLDWWRDYATRSRNGVLIWNRRWRTNK